MKTNFSPVSEDLFSSIRVLDDNLQDLPEDLYIPPTAFAILIEQFEGPLDFLLYLVQKNGFDLKTIDIAPIATQYLSYMEKMKALDIELTADYMLMAALLADLKSRLLLPKITHTLTVEADPRQQLIDRLEDYLRVKQAAKRLGQLQILERDIFDAQVGRGERGIIYQGYDANTLHDAMLCIFNRPSIPVHNVEHDAVHLEERMSSICHLLRDGHILSFADLLNPSQGRMGMVVTFIAVLELVKQQHVQIIHDGVHQPLSIQGKAYAKLTS